MKQKLATILLCFVMMVMMTPNFVFAEGSEDYGFTPTSEEEEANKVLQQAQKDYDETKTDYEEKENQYTEKTAAADTANKEYEDAKSAKEAADKEVETASENLAQAKEARENAEGAVSSAQTEYDAQQNANPNAAETLATAQENAKQAYDAAETANRDYESAKATSESVKNNLEEKEADLTKATADFSAAESNYNVKKSASDNAKAELANCQKAYDDAVAAASDNAEVKKAKQELAAAKTKVANAESALTQARTELNEAKAKKTALESEKETLDNELVAAKNAETPYRDAVVSAQKALDEANAEKAEAQQAVKDAKAEKAAAEKAVQEAQQELREAQANKNTADSELAAKKQNLATAQTELEEAEKAKDMASQNLANQKAKVEAAKAKVAEIQATIAAGSLGFFEHEGSTSAANVIKNRLATQDNDTTWGKTNVGAKGDATSLENFKESLKWIREANRLRTTDEHFPGNSELLITDTLMAEAQVNTNASTCVLGHSGINQGAENIAWGYSNPFAGWYYEEKELYESNSGGDGHYKNIVNNSYVATGFAINTASNAMYGITHGQRFTKYPLSTDTRYTVDEYEARLNTYITAVENEFNTAQAALDAANAYFDELTANGGISNADKAKIEAAAANVATCQQAVATAETAVANAQAAIDAANEILAAKQAVDNAKALAVTNAEANEVAKTQAAESAESNLASAQNELNTMTAKTAEAQSKVNAKASEIKNQTSVITDKEAGVTSAEGELSTAQNEETTKQNVLTALIEAIDSTIHDKETALDEAKANDESATTALNEAISAKSVAEAILAAAQTARDNAKTANDAATADLEAKTAVKTSADTDLADKNAYLAQVEESYQELVAAQKALEDAREALNNAINAENASADANSAAVDKATAAGNVLADKLSSKTAADNALSATKQAYELALQTLDNAEKVLAKAKADYEALVVTDLIISTPKTLTIGQTTNAKITVKHLDGSTTEISLNDPELTFKDAEIPTELTVDEMMAVINGQKITKTIEAEYRGKNVTATVEVTPIEYKMLSGSNYVRNTGSSKFRSNADFEKLLRVMVDGKPVDSSNYKAFLGSTIVEFTQEFMNSLTDGEHTVTILSKDGFAKTSFSVSDAPIQTSAHKTSGKNNSTFASTGTTRTGVVNTGDNTNVFVYIAIAILAIAGIFAMKFRKDK